MFPRQGRENKTKFTIKNKHIILTGNNENITYSSKFAKQMHYDIHNKVNTTIYITVKIIWAIMSLLGPPPIYVSLLVEDCFKITESKSIIS